MVRILLAKFSTFFGKVAENITVCRWGRILSRILVIWGSKPRSNIRSASSRTTIVTLFKLVTFPLFIVRRSIMRPGVQITISAPFFKSDSCFWICNPPYTAIILIFVDLQNFLAYIKTWLASSLVGVIISPMGPYPSLTGLWAPICLSIGNKYANVFPEPVSAIPITSLPERIIGIDWAWIGKGFS